MVHGVLQYGGGTLGHARHIGIAQVHRDQDALRRFCRLSGIGGDASGEAVWDALRGHFFSYHSNAKPMLRPPEKT